jgi:hypothetical protein
MYRRRAPLGKLLPQFQIHQDFPYHIRLDNKADDLHLAIAARAGKWVYLSYISISVQVV